MPDSAGTPLIFYRTAAEAWAAIMEACAAARESIEIEQYILINDAVGGELLKLLTRKAKEGIAVRLLVDTVGSRMLSIDPSITALKKAGGEVFFYNAVGWRHFVRLRAWFPRNHAKNTLVDNRIAFTGSVCFDKKMAQWRELHVRMEGAPAQHMQEDFRCLWQRMLQYDRRALPPMPPIRQRLRFISSTPVFHFNPIYRELLHELNRAKNYIYLATPYFVPSRHFLWALSKAKRRGVEIVLMTTQQTDSVLADCVARSYFPALTRRGVDIFLYQPAVMHAKYAVIDGKWATLGSMNLDYLSFRHNREANLLMRDRAASEQMRDFFLADVKQAKRAGAEAWYGLSWPWRLYGLLGRAFRRYI